MVLERAIVTLLQRLKEKHQVFGGIPGVHQHRCKRQLLLVDTIGEHLAYVIELAFAVTVRVIEAVVNYPKLVAFWVDVDARHHADALDDRFSVAAILRPHQFDGKRVVLVQHRGIKDHIAAGRHDDLRGDIFPDQTRRQLLAAQVAVDRIVTELLAVVRKVCQRVVDLAEQQILAIIKTSHFSFHHKDATAFSNNPRPSKSFLRKSYSLVHRGISQY